MLQIPPSSLGGYFLSMLREITVTFDTTRFTPVKLASLNDKGWARTRCWKVLASSNEETEWLLLGLF